MQNDFAFSSPMIQFFASSVQNIENLSVNMTDKSNASCDSIELSACIQLIVW